MTVSKQTKNVVTNRAFAKEDRKFIACCELLEIPPTARQASKYRNETGDAYLISQFIKFDEKDKIWAWPSSTPAKQFTREHNGEYVARKRKEARAGR